jgi:hypothetical protein
MPAGRERLLLGLIALVGAAGTAAFLAWFIPVAMGLPSGVIRRDALMTAAVVGMAYMASLVRRPGK